MSYKEIKSPTKAFMNMNEPEVIHIIKTGFKDMYLVIKEDAYFEYDPKIINGTKEEIENKYKIKL